MANFTTRVTELATATGTKLKELHAKIGPMINLTTVEKASIVGAINEIVADLASLEAASGAQIDDDAVAAADKTWSVNKIKVELQVVKDALLGGVGTAFDTLKELADALGNDPNLSQTLLNDIGKRVRFDAPQALTAGEKSQARENMGAQAADEIGFADNDFVAVLTTAMA